MESVGIDHGAFVAPAAFSGDYQQQQQPYVENITSEAPVLTTPSRSTFAPIDTQQSGWLDTPATVHVANHFESSNVRGSTAQDPGTALPAGLGNGDANMDAALNGAWAYDDGQLPMPNTPYQNPAGVLPSEPKSPSNTTSFGMEKSSAIEAVEAEQLTRAYAMVKFRDSHCYITTPNLVIVRDVNFLQDWQTQEKERKRRARAHEALQQYALEPSQPSQPGDDDRHDPSSRSGDSLVGRPERGLLSHYSEQGGPVAYALSDEEEEIRSTQRKRRLLRTLQNSSSANSIAPQTLHPNEGSEFLQTGQHFNSDGHPSDPLEWAQLPVHPPIPEDIKKISREHLIFSYNSDLERWELKVIGNRAFVNGTLYDKHDVVPLSHNDEIIIASLTMNFTLPDSLVREAESEAAGNEIIESVEAGSRASLTPERRFSNAAEDSDGEPNGSEAKLKRGPIKLKLNVKKDRGKDGADGGGKGQGKGKAKAEEEPRTTSISPEAMKKPSKAKKPSDSTETGRKESSAVSPPAVPLKFDPNSTLAKLNPDELPEKRKGPGRPPKNGLVSKRDEAIIRKKMKEREKKGLPIPEYRILLQETRDENKQRDMANKAQARGEPIPDIPVPSIENPRAPDSSQPASQPPPDSKVQGTDSPVVPERKASPKPRRVVRSPSPMKPMSDFTEEELKKPNMTYIYIIDEILQNVEGGQADLQTIYDKIQKRWPFYRYKVTSSGWQSSVRHNLLSCDRFQDAGKSGKGKLWTINYDHQLDKQKRKPSPPPVRPPPHTLQNGQFVPNGQGAPQQWYGQPPYNGHFAPPNPNNQAPPYAGPQPSNGGYSSPYGPSQPMPPGTHRPPAPGPAAPMSQMPQPVNGAYVRNGSHTPHPTQQTTHVQQPPAQASPQPTTQGPFQQIVDVIMRYRQEHLRRFVIDSEEYKVQEERFRKGTVFYSNLFHNQPNVDIDGEDLTQEPFTRIEQIFVQFRDYIQQQSQNNAPSAATGPNNASQANMGDSVGNNGDGPMDVPLSTSSAVHQQIHNASRGNIHVDHPPIHTQRTAAVAPMTAPPTVPAAPMSASAMQTSTPAPATAPIARPEQAAATTPPNMTHPTASAPPAPAKSAAPPTDLSSVIQNHGTPTATVEAGTKRAAEESTENPESKRIKAE